MVEVTLWGSLGATAGGKNKLDIRFWREGEQTAFEVIKGDPKLVESCELASKAAKLRTTSDLIQPAQAPALGGRRQTRRRKRL